MIVQVALGHEVSEATGHRWPASDELEFSADLRGRQPNDQCVAHHEGAATVGHAGVGPVIREAVQAFELDGVRRRSRRPRS